MLLSAMRTYMLTLIVNGSDVAVMELCLIITIVEEFTSVSPSLILLVACGASYYC